MKKFCSKCGSQLDLGKKACPVCHAFNPFFIAGYASSTPDEPVTKAEVYEEAVASKEIESQNGRSEQPEKDSFKHELLKVKEEAEQYKKQTLDLVNGVKKELEDIDKENKLLKEKVERLNNSRQAEATEVIATPPSAKKNTSSTQWLPVAAVGLAVLIAAFSYFMLNSKGSEKTTTNTPVNQQITSTPAMAIAPVKKSEAPAAADTVQPKKLLAAVTAPADKPKPVTPASAPTPAPVAAKPASTTFSLSAAKVIGDLVGKKLSGCDITINSASEVDHVDNLVLVEKLSAFYLKYKCTVRIKQGTETYTASPYIYYSAEGTFIKVDGTNCE